MTTTIWLVRHGETQSNIDGVFQGHMDTPLTNRGRRQAAEVAQVLEAIRFDAIYSSDLSRAAETARAIADRQTCNVTLDPDLRELHYGVLQGVSYDRFQDVLTDHGLAQQWGEGIFAADGMAPPGGESIEDLRIRITSFVEQIDALHPPERNESVMVVAHGGTLRVMMTVLLDLPIPARESFVFVNCCVSRVRRAGNTSRLDLHNAVYWDASEQPDADRRERAARA